MSHGDEDSLKGAESQYESDPEQWAVTPTQPTPEEQVAAQRIAALWDESIDELETWMEVGDPAIGQKLASAYLALLTQQSQERAELKKLKDERDSITRRLMELKRRFPTDAELEGVIRRERNLQAELDRAVERETRIAQRGLELRALAEKRMKTATGEGYTYEQGYCDGVSAAIEPLAASPGKGAEGEDGVEELRRVTGGMFHTSAYVRAQQVDPLGTASQPSPEAAPIEDGEPADG